jgi:peptide/nickel transport system permease protein
VPGLRQFLRRLSGMLALLALAFVASRGLVRLLPGDPVATLTAETGSPLDADALRAELGLDRPFTAALANDARRAIEGDLGRSLLSRQPVAPLLAERFRSTLLLTLLSLALGGALALLLGLLAAPGAAGGPLSRFADGVCTLHGALAAALPLPWIGPVLILAFAVRLRWLPLGGHVALPALALAIPFSGLWARLIRERVRETLRLGSAPGARARGLPEARVLWKYGLAPAAGPLLAYLGTQLGAFLSTGFVAEVVFNYPGMGSLLVDAVLARDYPVVEAAVFAGAACSLAGTWLGDTLQSAADPRVREEGGA